MDNAESVGQVPSFSTNTTAWDRDYIYGIDYLSHKVENLSHLVVQMRMLSMLSTNLYKCHASCLRMESLKNLGSYDYM